MRLRPGTGMTGTASRCGPRGRHRENAPWTNRRDAHHWHRSLGILALACDELFQIPDEQGPVAVAGDDSLAVGRERELHSTEDSVSEIPDSGQAESFLARRQLHEANGVLVDMNDCSAVSGQSDVLIRSAILGLIHFVARPGFPDKCLAPGGEAHEPAVC